MPWIREDLCTGCGACVSSCPEGAIRMVEGKAQVAQEKCTRCSACMTVCPTGAIRPNSESPSLMGDGKWAGSGMGKRGTGRGAGQGRRG